MHHFNQASLAECYRELDGNKAVGVDGIDKAQYGERLEENLEDLVERMKRMGYRPGPVRQSLVPKEGERGARRPLGISNFEDKLVQKMMQKVLESLYEPVFLECSYGFRPHRGCHEAVKALHQYLYRHPVETVIDVDIANFFGSLDRELLVEMLQEKIGDERLIRYLKRMFKAGILTDGELQWQEEGVVQGSCCSPVLANVYAHHVIDVWFETMARPHCRGRVQLFRYADDLVICCQYASDAERLVRALKGRLSQYRLTLNEAKTRQVTFSRPARTGEPKPGTFDFLGFTFYWGRSRRGAPIPKVKTSGKRLRSKLKNLNQWARGVRNRYRLKEIWRQFGNKLQGHIRYYGVSFNFRSLKNYRDQAKRILFKQLNRRSQRKSFTWQQFDLFVAAHPLPPLRIYHALF
jgi:group II intron reverse transcriptase/maturase